MSSALSALSERQKDELHKSMLDYLRANGMTESYQALAKEANLADLVLDPKAKYAGLLEKKWTSVIRLQKKTIDLEQRVAALQEELSAAPSTRRMASATDWVPRNPARHTLQGHRSPVTRLAFHPIFSQLVSASEDATLKLWDWETGEFERTLKGHTKAVQDADFDSKGNFLVSCSSDLSIKVWDTNNDWKNIKTLFGHDHSVSSVRFLPGDDMIVSASRDRTIRIWEMANGYCKRTLSGHTEWVRAVVPSLDGRLLASASNDQTACIWEFSSGEAKQELRGHEHVVECVVFAPVAAYPAIRELAGITGPKDDRSGLYVATGSRDKTLKLWDTTSGQCLKVFEGHDNWVRAIVFAPSGKYLLSASDDRTVKTWDLKTGRCAKTLEAHGHFITHLAWGRARIDGGGAGADSAAAAPAPDGAPAGANGKAAKETEARVINVAATCSVDLSIKVWTP